MFISLDTREIFVGAHRHGSMCTMYLNKTLCSVEKVNEHDPT